MGPAASPVAVQPPLEPDSTQRTDVHRAVRNAAKLSGALAATWAIGLAVRFVLPRHLGPELFGEFNFADAFAATLCVVLNLGLDTHVRKEVAVNPEHASGFYGGVQLVRTGLLIIVVVAVAIVLQTTRPGRGLFWPVALFAVAQYFATANTTLAAILHAQGTVNELSYLNVISKLVWGAVIGLGILMGTALLPFVLALLVSEGIKTAGLYVVAHRRAGLRFRIDPVATRAALAGSLPFFVGAAAQAAYSRLDVTVLSFLAPEVEVGYYGAAQSIASIGMLAAPLLGWVLTPALARAAQRSAEDLSWMMRRSLEAVLGAMLPAIVLLSLGAEVWTRLILGPQFVPAAPALAIVAGALVFTYLGTLSAAFLVADGRGWHMTLVMGAGLLLNLALNLALIRPVMRWLHEPGAGGIACAVAQFASELLTAAAVLATVGGRAWDRRTVFSIFKSLGICVAVVALDFWLRFMGPARLVVDAAAYLTLAVALGVIRPRELVRLAQGGAR